MCFKGEQIVPEGPAHRVKATVAAVAHDELGIELHYSHAAMRGKKERCSLPQMGMWLQGVSHAKEQQAWWSRWFLSLLCPRPSHKCCSTCSSGTAIGARFC